MGIVNIHSSRCPYLEYWHPYSPENLYICWEIQCDTTPPPWGYCPQVYKGNLPDDSQTHILGANFGISCDGHPIFPKRIFQFAQITPILWANYDISSGHPMSSNIPKMVISLNHYQTPISVTIYHTHFNL